MNSITCAIEVFESKIIEVDLAYTGKIQGTLQEKLADIDARDEELGKCLWAIEQLHAAYTESKEIISTRMKIKDKEFTNIS